MKNVNNYAFLERKKGTNIYYFNNISWQHIIQTFNTSNFKYINFTTTKESWNWYDYFVLDHFDIYVDIFDIKTGKFNSYASYKKVDNNYLYTLDIGQVVNKGFWLTYNVPITQQQEQEFINFDFNFGFVPDNLYYSINLKDGTRENNGAIIVDKDGNSIVSDLKPSDDIVLINYKFENISDVFKAINKFMKDNNRIISEISNLTNYFFISLNENIRTALIVVYCMLMLSVIVINLRR